MGLLYLLPEGKKPRGRPRGRREYNIKMNLLEIWWGVDYISLAQDKDRWLAVVDMVMNF
jgi:hypothetical protein